MLSRLIHWIKTGEKKAPKTIINPTVWSKGEGQENKEFVVQVKEDLVSGLWHWRILKDGEVMDTYNSGGRRPTRRQAVESGNELIKKIFLARQNTNQEWEDA